VADEQPRPLVDFSDVPGRLQTTAGIIAALAVIGCVVDGALNGLTFALMAKWAGLFAVTLLVTTAVVTAFHALGGADRADKRGERLSSPDVGISPRRLSSVPGLLDDLGRRDATAEDPDATVDLGRTPSGMAEPDDDDAPDHRS
jgi:hypothetical protein